MPFSPKQQYCGQTVLLTGGLGYLGSIVLEQLLRLTEVGARSMGGTFVRGLHRCLRAIFHQNETSNRSLYYPSAGLRAL